MARTPCVARLRAVHRVGARRRDAYWSRHIRSRRPSTLTVSCQNACHHTHQVRAARPESPHCAIVCHMGTTPPSYPRAAQSIPSHQKAFHGAGRMSEGAGRDGDGGRPMGRCGMEWIRANDVGLARVRYSGNASCRHMFGRTFVPQCITCARPPALRILSSPGQRRRSLRRRRSTTRRIAFDVEACGMWGQATPARRRPRARPPRPAGAIARAVAP